MIPIKMNSVPRVKDRAIEPLDMKEKFIEGTLKLILEYGGITKVNLRMVSKQIGCAHTNAYNYFSNWEELIFEAYDHAIVLYGLYVSYDLNVEQSQLIFIKFIERIIDFAFNYPGYYRFIGSDDLETSRLPEKTIVKVVSLRDYFIDVLNYTFNDAVDNERTAHIASIVMAYLDGELFNIINKRAFPEADAKQRIIKNVVEMIWIYTQGKIDLNNGVQLDSILSKLEYVKAYID